jgi:hypothetical protein
MKPCPCCGYLTFGDDSPGSFEICPVCFWEDDPVQFKDPTYKGGANDVNLEEARKNYHAFGACSQELTDKVRKPRPEEIPTNLK